MTEDKLNSLRQQDTNLRDALRQDEMERPQMPADLNARVLQKVEQNNHSTRTHMLWPWIAAACVAGVVAIFITPPKDTQVNKGTPVAVNVEQQKDSSEDEPQKSEIQMSETKMSEPQTTSPQKVIKQKEDLIPVKPAKQQYKPVTTDNLLAQEITPSEQTTTEKVSTEEPTVTLTESDIPITRPENYKHTPEELALLRKQADEAYLKWVELELEISKNNLQQTAQQ
ncbi:MAG: hypothetical protein IKX65_10825 [Prevotella sp.]|nr:hypothetical protein [Prevotella sp.]